MNDVMPKSEKISILDFLRQVAVIDELQYQDIQDAGITDATLQQYLVTAAIVSDQYFTILKKSYDTTPYVDLINEGVDHDLVLQMPEATARYYTAVLYQQTAGGYTVAMRNPLDYAAIETISNLLQTYITPIIAKEFAIKRMIDLTYRKDKKIDLYSRKLAKDIDKYDRKFAKPVPKKRKANEDSAGMKLLKSILFDAAQMNASDIHLELDKDVFRIRTRIDGCLDEHIIHDASIGEHLFRVLKVEADLDSTLLHTSQDSKISMQLDHGMNVTCRISIIPTDQGASVVIRLLNLSVEFGDLDQVVTDVRTLKIMHKFLRRKMGMLLLTGPTGSGKTTTLYTALKTLNDKTKKIITIEDPVELFIPGLNQIEINPKNNFGFAEALASCLRQDPDVLLVSEIREETTANIALRAAITGHLVLSTVHTRDSISTIVRLKNLQVPLYLIEAGIDVIIAQRLLRRNCPHCSMQVNISQEQKDVMRSLVGDKLDQMVFHQGQGCQYCRNSGVMGRIAIFECLELTTELKDCLMQEKINDFLALAKKQLEGQRLIDQALELMKQGLITAVELFSQTYD